jgi:hypothetical protein
VIEEGIEMGRIVVESKGGGRRANRNEDNRCGEEWRGIEEGIKMGRIDVERKRWG